GGRALRRCGSPDCESTRHRTRCLTASCRSVHSHQEVSSMSAKKKPDRPRRTVHKGLGVSEWVFRSGVLDGRFWALQFATPEEMARVAKAAGRDPDRLFKRRLRPGHIAADLYELILGERGTPAEVEAFWNHGLDEPDGLTVIEDLRYTKGFVRGIVDGWKEYQEWVERMGDAYVPGSHKTSMWE